MEQEIQDLLPRTPLWERMLVIGGIATVVLATWLVAHWLARRLQGSTSAGLAGLQKLAAPLTMLAAVGGASYVLWELEAKTPLLSATLELVAIAAGFWLGTRVLEVLWATGRRSARLRTNPGARSLLMAGRYVGKVLVVLAGAATIAIRLGASEQVYLVLGGLGAALAFAARDPIRNAVAFTSMMLDPPFQLGDRVRVSEFRAGPEARGEVVEITLSSTTIRTRQHTLVVVPNAQLIGVMRVENLSAASRRRLELVHPVDPAMRAEPLREACVDIEQEFARHALVSRAREPHVWLAGFGEGMRLRASVWLRPGVDRREGEHELTLVMHRHLLERARGAGQSGRSA